jgi:hypothetical protein
MVLTFVGVQTLDGGPMSRWPILTLLAGVLGAGACGVEISGTVTDYGSGQPVAGATIGLWDLSCEWSWDIGFPVPVGCTKVPLRSTVTDARGHFHIGGNNPEGYDLQVKMDGYLPYTAEIDATSDVTHDVRLFPGPPSQVEDLAATATPNGLLLSWTNPAEARFAGVLILRYAGEGHTESNLENGSTYAVGQQLAEWTVVYRGADTRFLDPALPDGRYIYRAYSFSEIPVYAAPPASIHLDHDGSAPPPVTDLAATQYGASVAITWGAAEETWAVLVVRKAGGPLSEQLVWGESYAEGATLDGGQALVVSNSSGDGCNDETIERGSAYHYTAFARDEWDNYSPGVTVEIQTLDFPLVDEWGSGPSLSPGRFGLAAVAHGGWLYVTGGKHPYIGPRNEVVAAAIQSDGSLADWAPVGSFSGARHNHTSVVVGDQLYVIGGSDDADTLADVQVATLGGGTVGPFGSTTPLPAARQGHAAFVHDGAIYVVGGLGKTGPLAEVLRAEASVDGSLGPWQTLTPLPSARSEHAVALVGDRVYVSGGSTSGAALADVLFATLAADGTLGPWSAGGTMSLSTGGRSAHVSFAHDGHLFVHGGTPGNDAVLQFAPINSDSSLGPWGQATAKSGGCSEHAAATHQGTLYLVGGSGSACGTWIVSLP